MNKTFSLQVNHQLLLSWSKVAREIFLTQEVERSLVYQANLAFGRGWYATHFSATETSQGMIFKMEVSTEKKQGEPM